MRKLLFVAGLLPALGLAEGVPARALTGDGELAYLRSSGSSNQETLRGYSSLRRQSGVWAHELRLEGINESSADTGLRTRERYFALEKTSWNFTPRDYLFLKPQYEKDLQTAYEYQLQAALGYGHQFLKSDALLLTADLGAGLRHSKANASGDSSDEGVASAALKFEWKFRPGAKFTEDVGIDSGRASTIARTRTALFFDLTTVFGIVVAHETRHDDGPVSLNDSITSVGLSYHLK